jgi:hypothetical protein
MKNIIIYTHMPTFNMNDGGTVVQYMLAKILTEFGQNVRIYPYNGITNTNPIFMKYYNNDFPIDDNTVVVYCEGTKNNPLNAKYVARWMLSKLGQNVPYEWLYTWGKNELVYYFNSEDKIAKNPTKMGNIFKFLNIILIHPLAINHNLSDRKGTCFTVRKSLQIHGKKKKAVHPPNSLEIKRTHSQRECILIFNKHKYFISYDPITFLSVIAALCGCISIVIKIDGVSKQEWLNMTAASEYLKYSGEDMLYGIAYGADDIENAINTIHLVKNQWENILSFSKNKYIKQFINDINDWQNNINTIQNNFY